jgi:hypothetical protein
MKAADILSAKEREEETSRNRVGTGFVVDSCQNGIKIITCAHLIDHVFTARTPISAQEVNLLFEIKVLCDHAEVHHRNAIAAGRASVRAYSEATAVDIECEKDMLLIKIANDQICRSINAQGEATVCQRRHPHIPRSLNQQQEEALDECIMISWPAEKHLTQAKGNVTHWSRTIDVMPGKNLNGYNMKLVQVDMRSEEGASGSALLNAQAQFMGMLHGGDVQFSYFVSLDDLSAFLNRNGVRM